MKKKLVAIAIGITGLFLALVLLFPQFFQSLEARWSDGYFRWRGSIPTTDQIVIAAIDEKSLDRLGRWPWPRSTIAQLLERLQQNGVKLVGMDIVFAEPSPEDAVLADLLRQSSQTILGHFFYTSEEEAKEVSDGENWTATPLSLSAGVANPVGPTVYGVQSNVAEIADALDRRQQGFFNVAPDPDGVVRSAPLFLFYRENPYPSLALTMAESLTRFSPVLVARKEKIDFLAFGKSKVPLTKNGTMVINYRGPNQTFPHLSIADILSGEIGTAELKDKIVLIGATAIGIYDLRVTPFSPNFPGVEIQANILDNLLKGDFLLSNTVTETCSYLLILAIGLGFGFFLPRFRALSSTFFFLIVTILLLIAGYYCFTRHSILLPVVKPILNGLLVFGALTVIRYFTEEKERRKIRKTFQYYLSPAVIKEVLDHPERLRLGGERKELTVLFCDIRDFTPKAETMAPEMLVNFLNDYFTVMTEILFRHEGTVDKFMGDAVMAIFGAPIGQPDHPERAGRAAVEMIEALDRHRPGWEQKYGISGLKIGIGIHTGTMAVGNMGSAKRFNYTVVGDAVNLASRLEGLTKEHNVPIICSEAHYQKIKGQFTARELGIAQVKGKQERIKIFSLSA